LPDAVSPTNGKRRFDGESGFALVIALLVVGITVALTLHLNTVVRSHLYGSANLRDGVSLGLAAGSGANLAMAVLVEDGRSNQWDTDQEAWADPKGLTAAMRELFPETRCELNVMDHSGRIQINLLVDDEGRFDAGRKAVLIRLLNQEAFGLDPEAVDNIVDAIKDWLDPDQEITRFGAEDGYYLSLKTPYRVRNGPLPVLEELLLVRGVTPELFYGGPGKPGISRYLTVHGDGRININTADMPVLMALSDDMGRTGAERLSAYRRRGGDALKDPAWYQDVAGLGDIYLPPELIGTSSTYFEIVSVARMDRLQSRVAAVVERDGGTIRVLSWNRS
jgi:general secretion pathway protein K